MAGSSVISNILGVRGMDLATRRANVVTPANFTIGGLMGHFQRRYNYAMTMSSPSQFLVAFGGYVNPAYYGPDCVNDFFNNLAGQAGQLYCAAYVGNTSGTINAVIASLNLADQQATPANTIALQAGYNGVGSPVGGLLQYGIDGNNTGVTVVTGNRFATTCAAAGVGVTGKTGNITAASNQVTGVATASATWIGMAIAAAGFIPTGTYIQNVTGTTVTLSQNATGTTSSSALTITQVQFIVQSLSDIEVGDAITIAWTGGTSGSGGYIVQSVNQGTGAVVVTGSGLAAGNFANIGDAISVPGFQLHTWRLNPQGVATEVDADLGNTWCTVLSAVTDHYVGTVFARSNYLNVATLTDNPTNPTQAQPAALATVTLLAGGADGTVANTQAAWNNTLQLFNNLPVRFLANCETSVSAVQVAGEAYCYARWDHPMWLYLFSANQSEAQLAITGNGYQRSGPVAGIAGTSTWGYKADPYNVASNAPYRAVPSVGAVMGLAIRIINKYGVHYTYGIPGEPIVGWQDVYGFQAPNDLDRTYLAQNGCNVIQNMPGMGIVLRNSLTPSTTIDYIFCNAMVMANYIRISCQGSLQATENFPLTYAKLQADRSACDNFLRLLWLNGSTGNVPEGETFGQTITQNPDGTQTYSTYEQMVSVEANLANNPQTALQAGNEQIYIYFYRPAPAQSIRIGVGVQLAA